MKRCAHYLKSNKNSETVHDAIWLDTETVGVPISDTEERHELQMGMAAFRRTSRKNEWTQPLWTEFNTIPDLWDWVEDRLHGKTRLYIFAHNWAFDGPVLDMFNELPKRGWKLLSAIINSPPIIIRWRRGKHTIQIVDTLNIWRMPLKKLGNSIGLAKLDMPHADAPKQDWQAYNKRDVEIIMEACIKWFAFLKDNDLGGFACTLAAQSMRTYRHKFMHHKILIDVDERALALARRALHGGRTECHHIGTCPETIHKLDINSQYPAIMATKQLPARLVGTYSNVTMQELTEWLEKYCVTSEVQINTNEPVYGVVHDNKLIFPVGTFPCVLSTPELEYALAHGHILTIGAASVYEKELLFKEYVHYFTKLRQKHREAGNDAEQHNAKIFMNALFGKWAQKGTYYEKYDETSDRSIKVWKNIDAETRKVTHYRQYAGVIEQQSDQYESRESHPAIAAHITAHARIQLWGLMQRAGHGNYYYNDTDSVWCNEIGAMALSEEMHPTELGALKLEGIHQQVIIHGPKDYLLDGIETIKGIRKTARKLEANVYEQERFTTLVGLLRRGDLSAPIVSTITKHLRRTYTKGVVDSDGRISPLHLSL